MSLAGYCPTSVNCGSLIPGLFLVGDILVFILLVIDLRLLKPRRYTPLFWVSPLLYGYLLLSLLGRVATEALGGSFSTPLLLAVSLGVQFLALVAGAGSGRAIGRRMKIGRYADGRRWFEGGSGLVTLLWVCLLPRAVVSAVDILNAFSVTGAPSFATSSSFLLLDVFSGSLAVLVAALTIAWKSRVSVRLAEMKGPT